MNLKRKLLQIESFIRRSIPKSIYLGKWYAREYCSPPSPHFVKQSVLLRHGTKESCWIETGTYLGSTTKILAKEFKSVHTIEPSSQCLAIARQNNSNSDNITYYNGTSEEFFESACATICGDACFWLDGHYSSGITFQGDTVTPITHELTIIERCSSHFSSIVVFIDDIRCSHLEPANYPSLNYYVEWANRNNLNWIIEHDIFIAKSKNLTVYPRAPK